MTTATIEHRRGKLALTLQEAFTAAVRLRTNRQIAADAESFRAQVKRLVRDADHEARQAGYSGETVKLAVYAFIVFLDECVLNSPQPMFSDWPRKPLQEEVFGGHTGGEIFFQNLSRLLAGQDSEDLADLLEVYQLCLLLGFRGRYSSTDTSHLQGNIQSVSDRIQRIRGADGPFSPAWAPPGDELMPVVRDPWVRRLGYAAAGVLTFAILLWVFYRLSLGSGIGQLEALALQLVP